MEIKNNSAFVGRIGQISPIEKADKIVSARVMLNGIPITQVVVGKGEFEEGDLIVYFDSNLCLSDVAIEMLNKQNPKFGEEKFEGIERYLARGNRIRTIKLRGTISDGLVIKPSLFEVFCKSSKEFEKMFVEGFSFTSLNDVEICHKYVTPVRTQSSSTGKRKKNSKEDDPVIIAGYFPEHEDTEQLLRNLHKVNPVDVIQISRKYHGCVSGDTLVETLEFGFKEIKEIVDNKISCHIKALNVETDEITFAKVDDFYKKENHGDWFEIELENGKKIRITGNNPVWLPELACYRRVDELVGNELLLCI